ncbi:MAG: alpha/beta hydrolase-fold protein [Colwellia sp.]|nr:alpha/beta hydrolase-fold protein [Colwellia sp.]MCW9083022.1 alpha/beta hydrolase-fold protein [Colwellia sp.]
MIKTAAKFACLALVIGGVVFFIVERGKIQVTFILESPSLTAKSNVYLVGSHSALGHWQPDQVAMTYLGEQQGNHRWQKQLSFEQGEILEYKFTQGSWANEGANSQGLPLDNNYLTVTHEQSITTKVSHWRTTADLPVLGQITGTVKYHSQLTGQGVLPRDVIVWLPPGYQQNVEQYYPVLYMHDGQNIIDPNTASFKVDWSIDETLTRLIKEKKVPPMIVVGMSSTTNRGPEYSPGADGEAYMSFVVNTVKPFIDNTYRTKGAREHTLVGGSSMGGMIALMLAWQYNDVFSKALCMSPAFKIDQLDYVATIADYQGPKKAIKIYIDNGGLGLEQRLQPGIDDMLLALKQQGYQNEMLWVLDKDAKHTEAAWAKRFPAAITWLMQKE